MGTDKALNKETSDESTLSLNIIHEYQDATEQRYRRSGRFGKTLTPSQTSVILEVVIHGVHLASSKLTDKEVCSMHSSDRAVMLTSHDESLEL